MLRNTGLILPAHNHENQVTALAWSHDGLTLAAALADNTIYTFHRGIVKHQIRVESINSRFIEENHTIKSMAFSCDSTDLAVALAVGVVRVYKVLNDWESEATINNEFLQNSAVTCLCWSIKGPILFGLESGRVRAAQIDSTEMAWTLYSTDSSTIALTVNDTGTAVISSHSDGSIIQCDLYNDGVSINRTLIRQSISSSIPRAIAWVRDNVAVVSDDRVAFYKAKSGKLLKALDFEGKVGKFDCTCCSTGETSVAVGLRGKVSLYVWNENKSEFGKEIDSSAASTVGTVTALAFKRDGTKLIIGGLDGTVAEFQVISEDFISAKENIGMIVRNVDSSIVHEISLENNGGFPASTVIWPKNVHPKRAVKIGKMSNAEIDESTIVADDISFEFKKNIETPVEHQKSRQKDDVDQIDYISSDLTSSAEKLSFSMDFGSILTSDNDDEDNDPFTSTILTPSSADGMLFQNLNDIPYDPTVDPPCWKNELSMKNRDVVCRNCGRLDVTMKNCPRCKDAYRDWKNLDSNRMSISSSPIRFTRQYTTEELRKDFTLQLALLASLSPGLQRILEQRLLGDKRDESCL